MHYQYTSYKHASKQNLFKFYNRNIQNISNSIIWAFNDSSNSKSGKFFRFDC